MTGRETCSSFNGTTTEVNTSSDSYRKMKHFHAIEIGLIDIDACSFLSRQREQTWCEQLGTPIHELFYALDPVNYFINTAF